MADAEKNNQTTEEEEAPVSNFYQAHIPHASDGSLGVRGPNEPRRPGDQDHLARIARRPRIRHPN